MRALVDKTLKPVLIIGGLGTALAGVDAFAPRSRGFLAPAIMDTPIVLWTLWYFASAREAGR